MDLNPLSAVAAEKRFLLVPWLFFSMAGILFFIIGVLSVMFSLADITALVVLFTAGITRIHRYLRGVDSSRHFSL